jgi:hypothetical protein
MTQAAVETRVVVARSGFANPIALGVIVTDDSYVKVYADNTLLAEGADYEITGIGDTEGIEVEIIGAEDVDNYVGTETFTVMFDPPLDQNTSLAAGGVLGRQFESGLDQLNQRMQALGDKVSRSLRLSPNMEIDGELPWPPGDGETPIYDADSDTVIWGGPAGVAAAAAAAAAASAVSAAMAEDDAEEAAALAIAAQAAAEAAAATAADKLPLAGGTMTGPIAFTHQTSPANPAAGLLSVFAKSDDRLYTRSSAGVEIALGSGDVVEVATRTALKALDTTKDTTAFLTEAGREGLFIWRAGNYSTQITADTAEGIYLKADAIASSAGAWVRAGDWAAQGADARWFGLVADYDPTLQTGTSNHAALNAAFAVADHVVLPAGNILISDRVQMVSSSADHPKKMIGAGRRHTRIYINDGFNLSADAVIKLTGGTGDRHTLSNFTVICQDQPDDPTLSNYIAYPPIIHAQNMPRFEVSNLKIQEAYIGIDMTGNSGGAYIDDLELSAFYRGILIDGSLDSVKITRLHWWPFGFPSVTNKKNVMAAARGIMSGRCDDFHLENSILFSTIEAAYFYTSVNGSTFGSISSTDFDDRGGLVVQGGDLVVTGCIFTMGTAKDSQVILLNNAAAKLTLTASYIYIGGAHVSNSPFGVHAGTFVMTGCIVSDVQNDNYTFRLASGGGSAIITGNHFLMVASQSYLLSLIVHTGPGTLLFANNTLSAFSSGVRSLVLTGATPGVGIIRNNLLGAGWTMNVDAANYNYYVERHPERLNILTADRSGSDVATAQAVFGSTEDALTVDGSTTYEFEALVVISRAAGTTSHTTAFLLGGTATFTSIDYLAKVSNPTGNVLGAVSEIQGDAATAIVLTAANTSATENVRMYIRGTMRINGGGTIIPQFQFSAAPGGTPTVKRNSFFRCRPIGRNTMVASGPWA